MEKSTYHLIENYMLSCMEDSAHGEDHIYRVLYNALEIARTEKDVDYDVLVCACLLHDIGRKEQFENPALCHAEAGGQKAYRFLLENGFDPAYFYTVKGEALAKERQHAAVTFYNDLFREVNSMYECGRNELEKRIQ